MEGLEVSEVFISHIKKNSDLRIEAEHYQKTYSDLILLLSRNKCNKLSELVEKPIQTGHTPSMKNDSFYGGNVRFIKTDNLRDNEIREPFTHMLSASGNNEIKRTELKEGDIITTIIGATYDVIARSCIVYKELLPANINQNIVQIRANKNRIDPEYLNIYLNTKFGKQYLKYLSRQMEQVNLNCEEVGNVLIPVPSKTFQHEIMNICKQAKDSSISSKCLYRDAEMLLLKELGISNWHPHGNNNSIKHFIDYLASGRLDAEYYQPKYDELDAIIKKHPYKTIEVIQTFNTRGVQPDYIENGEVPVVNSKHILEDGLDYDNFEHTTKDFLGSHERAKIGYGDILIYTTGANIGRAQVYLKKEPAVASNHVNILRVQGVNPVYLAIVLNSQVGRMQTEKLCTGSAQAELYPTDIEKFVVPILPDKTQQIIEDYVKKSVSLRQQAKQLLEDAKLKVETAITGGVIIR